jgi:amino acid permease
MSSLSGKIDKLKIMSIFGLVIIVYLIAVFAILCTDYYEYYNEREHIKIINFEWNKYFFSTYGICQYLFLNQYTVIPICNNVKMVTSKRITKVIRRTILGSLVIYFLVLFVGYFSQPNLHIMNEKGMEKLFILREKIPGNNDLPILIGKMLFGVYLIIAVLVKGHFFILYFNQLVVNTKNLIQGKPIIRAEIGKMVYDHEQTESLNLQKIETLSMDNDLITEILNDNNNISANEIVIETNAKRNKTIINFIFLFITAVLNLLLLDYLSKFLSIIGSFVSIFEFIVFPLAMLFALDAKMKLIGKAEKIIVVIFSSIFIIMGACSFVMSFFNESVE